MWSEVSANRTRLSRPRRARDRRTVGDRLLLWMAEYVPPRRGGSVAWPGLDDLYIGPA
jgi:hypothetical protein